MSVIEVDRASVVFGSPAQVCALATTTFKVTPGSMTIVYGPSGSGKTTLLSLLALLRTPSEGDVVVDGRSVHTMTDRERSVLRAQTIGVVFQDFHLFPNRTALQNVQLGARYAGLSRAASLSQAGETLRRLRVSGRAEIPVRLLSGGERQRVAVARALQGSKSILLADEPTGNLDSSSAKVICREFRSMADRGLSICVATHDDRFRDVADEIIRL